MIKFIRYSHVNDLIDYYSKSLNRSDIQKIIDVGILSIQDAEVFSRFIWDMVEQMNNDEENEIEVMGSLDNTEMLPDNSYEITK
jgi:hypothetical protein